jgi:hypothetical protein
MEALRSLIFDDVDWGEILPGFEVVLAHAIDAAVLISIARRRASNKCPQRFATVLPIASLSIALGWESPADGACCRPS